MIFWSQFRGERLASLDDSSCQNTLLHQFSAIVLRNNVQIGMIEIKARRIQELFDLVIVRAAAPH